MAKNRAWFSHKKMGGGGFERMEYDSIHWPTCGSSKPPISQNFRALNLGCKYFEILDSDR